MSSTPDIFLSYSRDDQATARHFAEGFEHAGFTVWWDVTLKSGEDYDQVTEQALRGAKAVVVLWSTKSVASRWVRTEATIALQSKTLVPVMIEPCQRPIMFELTQTADLSHWQGEADDKTWRTLLSDVQRLVHKGASAVANVSTLMSPAQVSEAATLTSPPRRATPPTKTATPPDTTGGVARWRKSAFAVVAVIAIAFAIPALQHLRETTSPPPPETRVDIVTPATDSPTDFALSPDGRQIVFVANGDGGMPQLWLRSLASTTAQPLAGTEGAAAPFWSPDGHALGFYANGALKRLDLDGGAPQTLRAVITIRGASWSTENVIVFPAQNSGNLLRMSANGGEATAITTLEAPQQSHRYPQFLPDGRRFLFYAIGTPAVSGIYLGDLDGSSPVKLTAANSAGTFLPGGWLLWVKDGNLTAQQLDLEQSILTGEPLTLASGVVDNTFGLTGISAAATGLIAYRTGAANPLQITRVARDGTVLGTVGEPEDIMSPPRVSPDGRRIVIHRGTQNDADLWLLEGDRTSRFTFEAGSDQFGVWSPDGSSIAFRSHRSGAGDIYRKRTSGDGVEEQLLTSAQANTPTSWSADGRFLLYNSSSQDTNIDMWVLPMTGATTPTVFLQTRFRESQGTFSPDGRWVVYQSDESGRTEVYVRAFVAPDATTDTSTTSGTTTGSTGGRWQISTGGGVFPAWSPDGKELYYLDAEANMMATAVTATPDSFEVGTPELLFPTHINGGGVDTGPGRLYDVTPDGHFLINAELDVADTPITLIQNWNPGVTP